MSKRQESEKKKVHDEIEQFKAVGMTASAPFYINEDKRKEREKALRYTGAGVAQGLHTQYTSIQEANKIRMQREAEERTHMLQQLADEDTMQQQKRYQ